MEDLAGLPDSTLCTFIAAGEAKAMALADEEAAVLARGIANLKAARQEMEAEARKRGGCARAEDPGPARLRCSARSLRRRPSGVPRFASQPSPLPRRAQLASVTREKERAEASGEGSAAVWAVRLRRLRLNLQANSRRSGDLASRASFKSADGWRNSFGGGGVSVGIGEVSLDTLAAGFAAEVHHADAPELRVRLGAVGARSWEDDGAARLVVRLSKLGIRGELGTGLLNLDAERVTLNVEFKCRFAVAFTGDPKGWTVGDGFTLDLRRVESRCDGGLVLTDTGLPMMDLPENVLKLARRGAQSAAQSNALLSLASRPPHGRTLLRVRCRSAGFLRV